MYFVCHPGHDFLKYVCHNSYQNNTIKYKIYCDIFGEKAFNIAKSLDVDGFKLHSSDLNNLPLLELLRKTQKKIFLSTGGSTLTEVNYAVNMLKENRKKPVLLHGFQSYPTNIEDTKSKGQLKL